MPNITFIMPHWLYWSGLILLPVFAMVIVRKQRGTQVDDILSIKISYMLLAFCGFIGMHRFYVKSALGLIYIPLFVAILYCNSNIRKSDVLVSAARSNISIGEFMLERAQKDFDKNGDSALPKLEQAKRDIETNKRLMVEANVVAEQWELWVRIFAFVILGLLIIDAFLLPNLVAKCAVKEADTIAKLRETMPEQEAILSKDEQLNQWFYYIDKVNGYVGEFVCYWAIIAVFVYYYEVLVRYVFNSPTNWAHESMYLMFGMQYVLAAGFTHREGSHVHVDVLYHTFSDRTKAAIGLFTSIFFFIFVIALFWTGWVFASDSIGVWEVSFTEWAIQYWPVKITMGIGAILLFLDGIIKVVKDFNTLRVGRA
ncbi:MAG: TRAP transporter small permease subunit [Deltaproteobacteria bacterium]|jgi:TRAP-type mannitol/chloroaromatic compound transport system permease small subunit|nr:TRAP transporter small permease subunit [Deltaproteobacteria bacterium]MBT7152692.1 TRAP transporter small permease subunit [Deltaproteobacteria bacterium]